MFYKSPGEVNPSKWSSHNQKLPLGMCMDMYLPAFQKKKKKKPPFFLITQEYTLSLIIKTFKLYIELESRTFEQLLSRPVLLRPLTVRI